MQKYYYDNNENIRFYSDSIICSTRVVKYRPRFSSVWSKNHKGHLPFRVADYYLPTLFYNGVVDRNKDIDFGYNKVQRGIWRNELAKILKENYDLHRS